MATIDSNIALGYRAPQFESPLTQATQVAQLGTAQQQNMLGRMQMAEMGRAAQQKNQMREILSGANAEAGMPQINALLEKAYIQSGDIPGLMAHRKTVAEAEAAQNKVETEKLRRKELQGKIDALPYELSEKQSKAVQERLNQTKRIYENLDPNDPNVASKYLAIHNSVHDDPLIGPLLNKMGVKKEDSIADINRAAATPQGMQDLINRSILGTQKFMEFTAPKTDVGKLMFERDKLPADDPRRKTYDAAILKATTQSPGTNVNVSLNTEKKYGEKFAGNIADADIKLKDAADAAPTLAENSNRISQILKSGKVFTGTGAEFKLQLAKALKLAGGTDNEAIANTETLISSLASQTLANIKSSNLGSGQGFTNTDREFLEKATAGTIAFDSKTLQRLADLSHKSAVASANKWNKRVKEIPSNAIEGTGLSTEPINVPPREGGATRKPTAVQLEADAILSGSKK